MRYKVEQFNVTPNLLVEESSTLGVPVGRLPYGPLPLSRESGIVIHDARANADLEFVLVKVDYADAEEEDISGWNFSPTSDTVRKHPGWVDHRVLIIND